MRIPDFYRHKLGEWRLKIATASEKLDASSGRFQKMEDDEQMLVQQVAELESSVQYDDPEGIENLKRKRTMLEQLRRGQNAAENTERMDREELRKLLYGFQEQFRLALQDELNSMLDEIAAALAPFWGRMDVARAMAGNTPKVQSFSRYFLLREFTDGREALQMLDAILRDECPWTWDYERPEAAGTAAPEVIAVEADPQFV